jgi:Tol biopolymer transport system component
MYLYNCAFEKPVTNAIRLLLTLITALWAILLSGCSQSAKSISTTRIAPLGKPPAEAVLWSPIDQSKILVSSGNYLGFGKGEIYVLDIETKEKRIITKTEDGLLTARAWSPDGKNIIVSAFEDTLGFEQGGLWKVNLDNGSTTYLQSEPNNIIWGSEKEHFIFERTRKTDSGDDTTELIWIDSATLEETVIFSTEINKTILGFSLSPDGEHLVFSMGGIELPMSDFDIYVLDIHSGKVDQITDGGDNKYPVWSPTSDLIAYEKKTYNGNKDVYSLYLINPRGSCNDKLLESDFLLPPTWSPDGNFLAYIESNGIYAANVKEFLAGNYQGQDCQ